MQRVNYYQTIHKAIRRVLFLFSIHVGCLDVSCPADIQKLHDEFNELKALLAAHAHHEDRYFQPLIDLTLPELSKAMAQDHLVQDFALHNLESQFIALINLTHEEKKLAAQTFYLAFNQFIADYLQHLNAEETLIMPRLWAQYSDETLLEPLKQLIDSMSKTDYLKALKQFIPAISKDERESLVANLVFEERLEILADEK